MYRKPSKKYQMIDWMNVYNDNNTHVAAAVCYLGAYTSTNLSTSLIRFNIISYNAIL